MIGRDSTEGIRRRSGLFYKVKSMTMTVLNSNRPRVCVVATTPLSVHFFLRGHLAGLAEFTHVTLATNPHTDPHTPPLNLPVARHPIDIERRVRPWKDLRALLQIFFLFRRERYDLVWAVGPKAGLLTMIAGFIARIPRRVFIFQGEVWASRRGVGGWVLKMADRCTARLATHLLAVAASERSFLAAEGVAPLSRTQVLGNGGITGVDLTRFHPSPSARLEIRKQLNIPSDSRVALFLGRFTRDKGILLLAEAFRIAAHRCSNLYLVLVGPDEEGLISEIRKKLGETAERHRALGFTSRPEERMACADFLCLPSLREGLNITVLEAGAMGLPTIGAPINGLKDIIQHGTTGYLVDDRSPQAWAKAIETLAQDENLREQLGTNAMAWVKREFNKPTIEKRYLDYFNACLKGPPRRV